MIKKPFLSLVLIISANAWAEKISFSCENIKNPLEEYMVLDIVIDTKNKTASIDGNAYNYQEGGDNITFNIGHPLNTRMVLNRMTGTLLAQTSRNLIYTTKITFKCKKAERLF